MPSKRPIFTSLPMTKASIQPWEPTAPQAADRSLQCWIGPLFLFPWGQHHSCSLHIIYLNGTAHQSERRLFTCLPKRRFPVFQPCSCSGTNQGLQLWPRDLGKKRVEVETYVLFGKCQLCQIMFWWGRHAKECFPEANTGERMFCSSKHRKKHTQKLLVVFWQLLTTSADLGQLAERCQLIQSHVEFC